MTWLTALIAVALVVAVVAVMGVQPKGGRNVSTTRLLSVGRVVLILVVLLVVWLIARGGGSV
jgi:hypothetical protein